MVILGISTFVHLLNFFVMGLGLLLIVVVLMQRGKGGGLAGAFGGAGGSSPFGSRAGTAFTRFTIVLALIWIVAIMVQVKAVQWGESAGLPTSEFGAPGQ